MVGHAAQRGGRLTPEFPFPYTRSMTSKIPADFRIAGVEIEVDPSPDAFAALRRVYSIIHAAPASSRTEVDSEAWLGAELPRMSIADRWAFLRRLERAGTPVPRRCVQATMRWLERIDPTGPKHRVQGVTG